MGTTVRRSTSRSAPRRKLVWARGQYGQFNTANTTPGQYSDLLTDLQTAIGADLVGATVVRIRGEITLACQDNVTTGPLDWYMGIIVTPTPLSVATSSGRPNVRLDPQASWMFYYNKILFPAIATAVGDSKTERTFHTSFDVKARRVLRQVGDTLIMNVGSGAGSPNSSWYVTFSVGLLLP